MKKILLILSPLLILIAVAFYLIKGDSVATVSMWFCVLAAGCSLASILVKSTPKVTGE
jgi:hypothetical protein